MVSFGTGYDLNPLIQQLRRLRVQEDLQALQSGETKVAAIGLNRIGSLLCQAVHRPQYQSSQDPRKIESLGIEPSDIELLGKRGLGFRTTDQITQYTRKQLYHHLTALNERLIQLQPFRDDIPAPEFNDLLDRLEAKLALQGLSLRTT